MKDLNHAESTAKLLRLIRERRTFLLTSHARPDGDAIGSSLGLMHLLDAMGKEVTVAFADPIPAIYKAIPGVERIVHELPETLPDAAIILECDSVARTGFAKIDAGVVINIDHHKSGRAYADVNWIDAEMPAVGAMIYDLAVLSGVGISPEMATALYCAVVTDTGGFTYNTTTAATFALAEHLLASGADSRGVTRAVYFSTPPSKMRLLGIALSRMQIDGPIAWSWVTLADMEQADADVEDCEGVVNYLIGMAGICAAVFLREMPDGNYRISMRSKDQVDVAEVAERFAGGGHRNASGGAVGGPLEDAVGHVVEALQVACESSAR